MIDSRRNVKKPFHCIYSTTIIQIPKLFGCAPQFWPKFVFKLLTLINPEIGLEWYHKEAHHKKRPMDGIGGTVKNTVFRKTSYLPYRSTVPSNRWNSRRPWGCAVFIVNTWYIKDPPSGLWSFETQNTIPEALLHKHWFRVTLHLVVWPRMWTRREWTRREYMTRREWTRQEYMFSV